MTPPADTDTNTEVAETAASVNETTVTGEGKEIADELTDLLAGSAGTGGVVAAAETGLTVEDAAAPVRMPRGPRRAGRS